MKNSTKNIVTNADELNNIVENIDQYTGKYIVIKYGGNAMIDSDLTNAVIKDICYLLEKGALPVLVHGGGPFIKKMLDRAGIETEFIDGHRVTSPEAMKYVEMALKGEVNGQLINIFNQYNKKAVGLSGKDARMVIAEKRMHYKDNKQIDLGLVGNVKHIDTTFLKNLLHEGYIPVIASIGAGEDGHDYNINADMFAGHLAGALGATVYITMTDVDGLLENKDDPRTIIKTAHINELENLKNIIQSGMIPKIESCCIALNKGVSSARIINGTKKHSIIRELYTSERSGSMLYKDQAFNKL